MTGLTLRANPIPEKSLAIHLQAQQTKGLKFFYFFKIIG
jgi:hypothetical protein